jgi:mono/diheme cytochrome c family protein
MASSFSFSENSLVDEGFKVHQAWCQACHGDGPDYPGTLALKAKYKGAIPPVLAQRTDLTPELVEYYVRNGINVMPFFRKTEVSDKDLEALGAYLSRNNKSMK